MTGTIINLAIVVLILGMTYALTSEGLWGAALMFFNVLFSGLIAFNFYEPLAQLLATSVAQISGYADTLCLLGLFIITLVIMRMATESMAPAMVRFPTILYQIGRFFFGLAASTVTIAILLLAFMTSPVDKKMFKVVDYKFKPPFGMAIDRQWLAFFQHTTGVIFASRNPSRRDPFGEFGDARVFDPTGSWLIEHQNARPYGDATVPEADSGGGGGGEAAGGEAGAPAAGGAGGGAAPGPGASNEKPGMGIPGGTAGAAVGLAPQI